MLTISRAKSKLPLGKWCFQNSRIKSLYINTRTWDMLFKGHINPTATWTHPKLKQTPFQHFSEASVIAKRGMTSNFTRPSSRNGRGGIILTSTSWWWGNQKARPKEREEYILSGPKKCPLCPGALSVFWTINEIITSGHKCHENPTFPLGYSITSRNDHKSQQHNLTFGRGKRNILKNFFWMNKVIKVADLGWKAGGAGRGGGPLPENA